MLPKKEKNIKVNEDIVLRANLAQAIKILYIDRNGLFYPENKHYKKLKETLDHIIENLKELKEKKPRMLIMANDHFNYEAVNGEIINSLIDYLNFILFLPPPNSILTRFRKTVEIGKMKVPTLSYISYSLLNYKLPDYWKNNMEAYTGILTAIMALLNENSTDGRIGELVDRIKNNIDNNVNNYREKYIEKIREWLRLGLLI